MEAGLSLLELVIAAVVVSLMLLALVNHVTIKYSTTKDHRHRVFAYNKAQAILSEMRSLVEGASSGAAKDLDALDDGSIHNPSLSISTEGGTLVPPDHPLSGNIQRSGRWYWSRRIEVRPFAGLDNRNVRYVTVRIYRRTQDGRPLEWATLSSVINSVGNGFPTTQVFDVYLLAIENIPGWWVYMENIIPSVEAAITDLEGRNPGLALRTHWITKAGYGRNRLYRPFFNDANDSHDPVNHAYYYPGTMPAGNASNYYYVPPMVKARINVDGTEVHGFDNITNPHPYALADFYNHAMRLPRARALHDQRVAAVRQRKQAILAAKLSASVPPPEMDDMSEEPTLQLLLEDMNTDPDKYRHALIMNLHGELIPMPSIRNYSDPAKDPQRLAGVRVVTHPEQIRTTRDPGGAGIEDVYLRVYAWTSNPSAYSGPAVIPQAQPIAIQVMDLDLTNGSVNTLFAGVEIKNMPGGVPVGIGPAANNYALTSLTNNAHPMSKRDGDLSLRTNEMYYGARFVDPGAGGRKYTIIYLYNTPVVAPRAQHSVTGNWQGLNNNTRSRLYGLEYVPSATRDTTFDRDLSATGDGPKNTARWRIKIPKQVFAQQRFVTTSGTYENPAQDVMLTFRTRIFDGSLLDPFATGAVYPVPLQPDNLSETYTWWSDSRDDVPVTERAQFLGDPRFNPYLDLLHSDPDFGDGYNWSFDGFGGNILGAGNDFPGLIRGINRWNGQIRQDALRFYELYRSAIVNAEAVYTTLTGYSYYYMGHGNEIGYDSANGYPNSIPTHLRPFGSSSSTGYINNITGYRRYVRAAGGGSSYWWGMPWLGELYPDSAYLGSFLPTGNLPAGTGSGQFFRQRDSDCHDNSTLYRAYDTNLDRARQRTQTRGCVAFMNNGNDSSHFNHHFSNGSATLVGPGLEMANNYNFPLPPTVSCNRPFTINSGGNVPDGWNWAPYVNNRYVATIDRVYYIHPSGTGSGLVRLTNPAGTSSGNIVVNGLNPTTTLGSTFIAKLSQLAMLQSFFELGATSMPNRIKQPPRVEILAPTDVTELDNPVSVVIKWDISWVRWDGQSYTATTPMSFVEAENEIEYVLMYSSDQGLTWKHVQDNTTALQGVKPSATYVVPDLGAGQETFTWSVPAANFPQGQYLIRVEAYRQNQSLHYSQHMMRIFVDR